MRVVLGGDSFAKCSVTDIDNFVSQLPVDSSFFYDHCSCYTRSNEAYRTLVDSGKISQQNLFIKSTPAIRNSFSPDTLYKQFQADLHELNADHCNIFFLNKLSFHQILDLVDSPIFKELAKQTTKLGAILSHEQQQDFGLISKTLSSAGITQISIQTNVLSPWKSNVDNHKFNLHGRSILLSGFISDYINNNLDYGRFSEYLKRKDYESRILKLEKIENYLKNDLTFENTLYLPSLYSNLDYIAVATSKPSHFDFLVKLFTTTDKTHLLELYQRFCKYWEKREPGRYQS